jgi:starch synthase
VVEDGVTGVLVPFERRSDPAGEPVDPAGFARDLARGINDLLADPARAREMGRAGRRRAIEHFSWSAVARRTVELYRSLLGG